MTHRDREEEALRAQALREQWSVCLPQRRNLWAPLSYSQKHSWLLASASAGRTLGADHPPGQRYTLDGAHVTDYPSFFLAMGEAIHGPTGYFGMNLDALVDCLRGGFGALPPFVLEWREHHVARDALDARAWSRELLSRPRDEVSEQPPPLGDGEPLWDVILEILQDHEVDVHLL